MTITHLSTYDIAGGAARAAYRLHIGLQRINLESHMLVLERTSEDSSVDLFRPPRNWTARVRRTVHRTLWGRYDLAVASRPQGATFFSHDRSQYGADVAHLVPPSGILHLHWIAKFLDYKDFFGILPRGRRVVWTLHDMNQFTGGCHYSAGCLKFAEQCGACPQLESVSPNDLSRKILNRKRSAYAGFGMEKIHFVAPSRWLASEARRSKLLCKAQVSVIPYSLDTETFSPRDRPTARKRFGIPNHARVLLFVAGFMGEKRKGLALLLDAIRSLSVPDLFVVIVGRGVQNQELPCPSLCVDFVSDEALMSTLYSTADLFIIPSLEDNFPNTALEAGACGVPVVGFRVGGLPEIVLDGETGALITPGDISALRGAISALMENPEQLQAMSRASRIRSEMEFHLQLQAHRYAKLYETLECGGAKNDRL